MQPQLIPESPLGDQRSLAKNRVWDFFQDSPTFTRAEQSANTDSTWGFDFLTENSRRGVLDQLITSTAPTGTTSYSYDASGNLIEKSAPEGVTTYGYDWQDRLITVTTPEHTASYEYDHDGIRVAKTVDGVRINFTVDKNRPYAQVIEERDDGGALLASYVHGVDLISQHRGGHDYYYHTDEQGSVVTLSDENGAKAAQYYYTSYGELWNQGQAFADTNKYRYTGEQFDDETGFYYLRARYYDPGVGRFVTRDTHPGSMMDPLSMNKYLYGNANPMLYVDPSGHMSLVQMSVTVAVVGILASIAIPIFVHGLDPIISNSPYATRDWGVMFIGGLGGGVDFIPGTIAGGVNMTMLGAVLRRGCRNGGDDCDLATRDSAYVGFGAVAGWSPKDWGSVLPVSGGAMFPPDEIEYTDFKTSFPVDFDDFDYQNVLLYSFDVGAGVGLASIGEMAFPLLGAHSINISGVGWAANLPGATFGVQSGLFFVED